ncbi:MAG TPA: SIS domain-containing protein [Solirubrobacterales bacterium]|nr:SIS domain-containing protein [Solirubrobacterales bacterium]
MTAPSPLGSCMASEMAEQPRALRELLDRQAGIRAMLREVVAEPPRGVLMLARGTSDNAAIFGRYLLEIALGVPVGLVAPSIWTRYARYPDLSGQLLIALSQSGRTPEIERVVQLAGSAGATAIAVTNDERSPLAEAAHGVIALGAGLERAVPATKTFTTQLAAIAIVADALSRQDAEDLEDLAAIPALQERVLEDDGCVREAAAGLVNARAVVTVGSGLLYPVALEAGLKLLETTSIPVLSYSASDFVHGPLAVAGPEVPLVCFAATGPVHGDVVAAAGAASDRGSHVVWVSDFPGLPDARYEHLPTPSGVREPLTGLLHAVRAQQLSLEMSRALGRDPDAPYGLQKVTPTA